MKIYRSTKCSLKFATADKRRRLERLRQEYARACNFFIDQFWPDPPRKGELLKPIVDSVESWLSFTVRLMAAREAVDMIVAARKRQPARPVRPVHKGRRLQLTHHSVGFQLAERSSAFDAWLHLGSLGMPPFDVPLKLHRHFQRVAVKGVLCGGVVLLPDCVQLSFKVETGPKRQVRRAVGIDTGINALASLSDGRQLGSDIRSRIDRVNRCRHGSRGSKRAIRALKHYIDETARKAVQGVDAVVVERLRDLNHKTKARRRVGPKTRRLIGRWNWRYWLTRVQFACEDNRVVFRTVSARHTSRTCPSCGHVDQGNRNGRGFHCRGCGYTGDADITAAVNILQRSLQGEYSPLCEGVVGLQR